MPYSFKNLSPDFLAGPYYAPTDHMFQEHLDFWRHSEEGIKVSSVLSTCIHCGLRRNPKHLPPVGPCPGRVAFEVVNENAEQQSSLEEAVAATPLMYLMGA